MANMYTSFTPYGQLRRNTDRRSRHRHAALCLATDVLIIGKHHLARALEPDLTAPIRSSP